MLSMTPSDPTNSSRQLYMYLKICIVHRLWAFKWHHLQTIIWVELALSIFLGFVLHLFDLFISTSSQDNLNHLMTLLLNTKSGIVGGVQRSNFKNAYHLCCLPCIHVKWMFQAHHCKYWLKLFCCSNHLYQLAWTSACLTWPLQ